MQYERVTFKDGGVLRTVILRIAGGESARFLCGTEVRLDGDEISGATFDRRLRIIEKSCITKRVPLRMNNTYCELEAR